jgi:signal transduction histidine kinase/CheY-like chemotaxis protein/KaiC/GvpD/RAD55 family RecA-like ATPase
VRSSGIPEFDKLLGGGIESGSSTLVIGPAGTGKSLVVLTMAMAAVKRGERAALFIFDEELGLLFARTKGMGIDLEAMRESGNLFVEQIDAAEISPGEFAHKVRKCVEKEIVQTVVVDSLNGYHNAMPEEQFLTLHMHELLQYLNRLGAATFLTVAQHGMIGEMKSPVDVTYLADTVLMLRYFEARGRVRRACPSSRNAPALTKMQSASSPSAVTGCRSVLRSTNFKASSEVYRNIWGEERTLDLEARIRQRIRACPDSCATGTGCVCRARILDEAGIVADICKDLSEFLFELDLGAAAGVLTEDAIRDADLRELVAWVARQPPWSDFPFILLTERGAGLERNPAAQRQAQALGNVSFLERPFHPTTFVSVVKTALRGRRRQYEARSRLEALHESEHYAREAEAELRQLNETLENRVAERAGEIEAANRQLLSQIEERERVESTLRQMQRLEAVGQLTSGVAHDFNNLLTVIIGNLGFIEKEFDGTANAKLKQRFSHMRLAAERGAKLTAQLLAFSRRQRLEPKPTDLNEALANMGDLLESSIGGSVQINSVFREGLWPALVDPTQVELVVLNLAINARDASPVGGTITLETANVTLGPPEKPEEPPAGEYVMIAVTDNGSGMSKDVLAKVFEPFFTTKDVGKGSGLGLSQVLGFAKQSNGGVRIESRVGEGTCVKVFLPRAAASDGGAALDRRQGGVFRASKGVMILLVDDDDAVREIACSMLRDVGYGVTEVGSGGAALDLLNRERRFDLVVLDFAMPGMNGMELAREVNAKFPGMPVLFITGYADNTALAEIGEPRIVKKPFLGDELVTKVQAALASGDRRSRGQVIPLRR